jgi:hypothetical protein
MPLGNIRSVRPSKRLMNTNSAAKGRITAKAMDHAPANRSFARP